MVKIGKRLCYYFLKFLHCYSFILFRIRNSDLSVFGRNNDFSLQKGIESNNAIYVDSPAVTFIADDGYKNDYSLLVDVSKKYKVPFCVALHDFYKEKPYSCMSKKNALYAQNELGWEFLSHVGGEKLSEFNDEHDIERCIVRSLKVLYSDGLICNNIAYPNGANDERVRKIAKKYFHSGCTTKRGHNKDVNDVMQLKRWALGSFYQEGTFDGEYKKQVDYAVANNTWLIFMLHPNNKTHDENQQRYFEKTVEYCIVQNIPIITMEDALKKYGDQE